MLPWRGHVPLWTKLNESRNVLSLCGNTYHVLIKGDRFYMATARWFFQPHVSPSRYVVQEHLRQDFWRAGPATMWVDVTQTTIPCKAVGYWHDVNFELEWVPLEYVILRASQAATDLVKAISLQLGFQPSATTEDSGKSVVTWYLHPSQNTQPSIAIPAAQLDPTPESHE